METTMNVPMKIQDVEAPERSTQCLMCSRIYFGRNISQCPHCGSRSVTCYTTEDFSHFERSSAGTLSAVSRSGQAGGSFPEPIST